MQWHRKYNTSDLQLAINATKFVTFLKSQPRCERFIALLPGRLLLKGSAVKPLFGQLKHPSKKNHKEIPLYTVGHMNPFVFWPKYSWWQLQKWSSQVCHAWHQRTRLDNRAVVAYTGQVLAGSIGTRQWLTSERSSLSFCVVTTFIGAVI